MNAVLVLLPLTLHHTAPYCTILYDVITTFKGSQNAVLVSLQNEFFLMGHEYPFNVHSGAVKLADGITYDMASDNSVAHRLTYLGHWEL